MEKTLSERELNHFVEQLSRIISQVNLIKSGRPVSLFGRDRLDIIQECAKDLNEKFKTHGLINQEVTTKEK